MMRVERGFHGELCYPALLARDLAAAEQHTRRGLDFSPASGRAR
ncbi:MAG: hypothetical protein ACRECZ_08970 [Methylocella sp.]